MRNEFDVTEKIEAPKVTKPIQLLAAWLIGLIAINGSFLTAASIIAKPDWASGALTIAAIVNVPLFLACLFLLQTRFRPEMQEDEYYSRYLAKRWSTETNSAELVEVKIKKDLTSTPRISTSGIDQFRSIPTLSMKDPEPRDIKIPKPRVIINDLLPRYEQILDRLQKSEIQIRSTFGTTSAEPRVPKNFVITFSKDVDVYCLKFIIKSALDLGLNGIGTVVNLKQRNTIYIGSYAFDAGRRFSPIDADILSLIDDENVDTKTLFDKVKFRMPARRQTTEIDKNMS